MADPEQRRRCSSTSGQAPVHREWLSLAMNSSDFSGLPDVLVDDLPDSASRQPRFTSPVSDTVSASASDRRSRRTSAARAAGAIGRPLRAQPAQTAAPVGIPPVGAPESTVHRRRRNGRRRAESPGPCQAPARTPAAVRRSRQHRQPGVRASRPASRKRPARPVAARTVSSRARRRTTRAPDGRRPSPAPRGSRRSHRSSPGSASRRPARSRRAATPTAPRPSPPAKRRWLLRALRAKRRQHARSPGRRA